MSNSKTIAVAANLGARIIAALLNLILLPVFLKLLGPEGYGIVGFYSTLLITVNLLDGGLSAALNRELAQSDAGSARGDALSAAVAMFLILSSIVVVIMWLAAPWIATHWINSHKLPLDEITWSLRVMGVVFGQQLLISCYQGALYGLHRQLSLNLIAVISVIGRALASLAVLIYITPSPTAFLTTYSVFSCAQIIAMRLSIRNEIEIDPLFRRFNFKSSKMLLHSTTGVGAMGVLAIVLSQVDKFTVSRMLPLEDFSYYIVASTAAQVSSQFMISIILALFPYFSSLAARDRMGMLNLYHLTTQLIAAVTIPVGVVFALFPREILFAWTGNADLAQRIAPILAILASANSFYVYWEINHYVEVANRRTRTFIIAYALAVAIFLPAVIWATRHYGMAGTATAWLLLSLIFLFAVTPLVMRKSLGAELRHFFLSGVVAPLAASLVCGGIARALVPRDLDRVADGVVVIVILIVSTVASTLWMPDLRRRLKPLLLRFRTLLGSQPPTIASD